MTAREKAVLDYWRTSQAALAGSFLAARKLCIVSEMYRDDTAHLAQAATSSLTACAMRSGVNPDGPGRAA